MSPGNAPLLSHSPPTSVRVWWVKWKLENRRPVKIKWPCARFYAVIISRWMRSVITYAFFTVGGQRCRAKSQTFENRAIRLSRGSSDCGFVGGHFSVHGGRGRSLTIPTRTALRMSTVVRWHVTHRVYFLIISL